MLIQQLKSNGSPTDADGVTKQMPRSRECQLGHPAQGPSWTAANRLPRRAATVRRFLVGLVGLMLLTAAGCRDARPGPTFRQDAAGIVKLDDQPLAGARVVLIPVNPELGVHWKMSYGLTDEQGQFQLKTRDGKPGVWSGRHLVIISKPLPRPDDALAPFMREFMRPIDEVPEMYNRLSELEIEIPPSGEIDALNFELSSIDPLLRDL